MTGDEAAVFQVERTRLFGLAYRLLGSASDAEDMLQEAFLRWSSADTGAIERPAAWLTRVVVNLCLTELASARARRESYVGPWLPEPVLTSDLGPHAVFMGGPGMKVLTRLGTRPATHVRRCAARPGSSATRTMAGSPWPTACSVPRPQRGRGRSRTPGSPASTASRASKRGASPPRPRRRISAQPPSRQRAFYGICRNLRLRSGGYPRPSWDRQERIRPGHSGPHRRHLASGQSSIPLSIKIMGH